MFGDNQIWVQTKLYRRRFRQPLQTFHGSWQWREGILLKLTLSSGRAGFGEVSPLPWFGTESLEEAQHFLDDKAGGRAYKPLLDVPDRLPATQFGIETALNQVTGHSEKSSQPRHPEEVCGLLPAGERALDRFPSLLMLGHRAYKWKMGVFSLAEEMAWFRELVAMAGGRGQFRLDANGGLNYKMAQTWLETCDALNSAQPSRVQEGTNSNPVALIRKPATTVEYLEQPLPPTQQLDMRRLCSQFQTPIALDESVSNMSQLTEDFLQSWPGYFVIKPAITGFPSKLLQKLDKLGPRVIFSSVFETVVGHRAALEIARAHYRQGIKSLHPYPALGFNTLGYFDDDWDTLNPEQLWDRI